MEVGEDKGWAWVVLAACFLNYLLIGWFVYSVGVIHMELVDIYQEQTSKTVLVGALHSSIVYVAGPVSSVFVNVSSCRVTMVMAGLLYLSGMIASSFMNSLDALIFTYGICSGSGMCLAYVSGSVAVGYHFNKYRGFAMGIASCGLGVGTLFTGPITRLLLDTFGLHGSFLIMGAIGSHFCLVGLLIRPTCYEICPTKRKTMFIEKSIIEEREHLDCENDHKTNLRTTQHSQCNFKQLPGLYGSVLRNKAFISFGASIFCRSFGMSVVCLYLPITAKTQGTSLEDSALLMTYYGAGSLVSRPLVGALISGNTVSSLLLHLGQTGVAGMLAALFPLFSRYHAGQILFAFCFGAYIGGGSVLLVPLTVTLVGIDKLTTAFGILAAFNGVGYLLGPPSAGILIDVGTSYDSLLVFAGSSLLIASLTTFLVVVLRKTTSSSSTDAVTTTPTSQTAADVSA